jgi:hypothetical protein
MPLNKATVLTCQCKSIQVMKIKLLYSCLLILAANLIVDIDTKQWVSFTRVVVALVLVAIWLLYEKSTHAK